MLVFGFSKPPQLFNQQMDFPKSFPNLSVIQTTNYPKRQSKDFTNSKELQFNNFKIINPFRNPDTSTFFPPNIRNQISKIQFISKESINNIKVRRQRHSSSFHKNLQMMQQLAKKQQQKYSCLLRQEQGQLVSKANSYQQTALTIVGDEDDKLSIELSYCDYKSRMEEDFNIFEPADQDYAQYQPAQYYTVQEIQAAKQMDQELANF